jgi:hypothetical protein
MRRENVIQRKEREFMESLPYRATVLLRPHTIPACRDEYFAITGSTSREFETGGELQLMERFFAREADAVQWCNVMAEAEPQATGAWFVAVCAGGRVLRVAREAGAFSSAPAGIGRGQRVISDELEGALFPCGSA